MSIRTFPLYLLLPFFANFHLSIPSFAKSLLQASIFAQQNGAKQNAVSHHTSLSLHSRDSDAIALVLQFPWFCLAS